MLDWEPATCHWRLWNYDGNATGNTDPLPGKPYDEATGSNGLLEEYSVVIPIEGQLLFWQPSNGNYTLVDYIKKPSANDYELFSGDSTSGHWHTVGPGHELINLGRNPGDNDKPRVLDWEPETGNYRIWRYDANAITTHTDPLPGPAVAKGTWQGVRTGHKLISLFGNRLLDWEPETGDYRIWEYNRS